ncbi:MAG: DUF2235 domain-containing protein [Gammaproteobacteria bacterium]|nr:DUF2235 domain-containing protein [Gammaproteobacteria bacterium]
MTSSTKAKHRLLKRLIVCLDGTWNRPDDGENPTNVTKIMRALRHRDDDSIPQIAFYDKGVGIGGLFDRISGGAFGLGVEEHIQNGYRFLANNYEAGDEIYLFGFSRGAFAARSLAGFIGWMGLLFKGEMRRLPLAWSSYRKRDETLCKHLKENCVHKDVQIKCIGVWDTVGSLGIPRTFTTVKTRKKYGFHDTSLDRHIEHAFHALSIDEKRGSFEPALWECKKDQDMPSREDFQQVWFAGVHSNVGGSYADTGLSDIALDWMIKRVEKTTNLAFDKKYREKHIRPNHLGTLYDSLNWFYIYSRLFPFERVPGRNAIAHSLRVTLLPEQLRRSHHPKEGCRYVNEMIHRSALERFVNIAPQHDGQISPQPYAPASLAEMKDKLPIIENDGSITDAKRDIF